MKWTQLKNPKLYGMIFADGLCFTLSLCAAYYFRFEFELTPGHLEHIGAVLPYLIPLKLAIFYLFGLYRGMWRYSSLDDFWRLIEASTLSTFILVFSVYFLYAGRIPRSVVVLDCILTVATTGGLRAAIRSCFALGPKNTLLHSYNLLRQPRELKKMKSVLIIGAGRAGESILREMLGNPQLRYVALGFIDDDPKKKGRSLHGVPVLGGVDDLPEIVASHDIEEVFITIPSATGSQIRRIVETCKLCKVDYKTLPGMAEIIDGKVGLKRLRNVNYEDLLGREPVRVDLTGICDYLEDRIVMITGCGGSIGSELCRRVVRFKPRHLILVDACEANLFHIQMELQNELNYQSYFPILAMVQDAKLMELVFQKYRPQVVFHAAACKHVPMLEKNPWEAISNNVLGSKILMELADQYNVERFVLVSTDKAVRPTNVMGATKRVAELLLQSFHGSRTRFMAVRFGNVVGSSGSVIPLFQRQIEQGGPLTITHPEVTRYFMTIPEAARLILQAGAMGRGGEVFLLKMGTPVKIAEMALDLIRLSGKEPGRDIEVVYTGLREGEKLTEELITEGEGVVGTRHDKIMVLRANGNGHGGPSQYRIWINRSAEELWEVSQSHDGKTIKQKLREIVPEYTPQEASCVL